MLKRIVTFVLIVVAVIALLHYSQRRKDPFRVSGFVEADEIRVGSRVGGRVAKVSAEEGQKVQKGDVLVELEPFDLLESRARAEAELTSARADERRYAAGFRSEDIAQAKAKREQIAARLAKLVSGPRKQEIATARAQLSLAEAEMELSVLELDRAKKLFHDDVSSRELLDRATTQHKTAQAGGQVRREELALLEEGTRREEIDEAKAQLEEADQAWQLLAHGYREEDVARAKAVAEAGQAQLRQIERQIEELSIRAPVDGRIEAVDLRPGDIVAANTPAFSIMDLSRMWVRAYVPESRLDVQVGQKVAVTVDAWPGERFAAHVSFVARQAEFTPSNVQTPEERSKQVFRIKVLLDEGLDRLRPGMSADVHLEPTGASKGSP
jgi:HlyD family secretion protein